MHCYGIVMGCCAQEAIALIFRFKACMHACHCALCWAKYWLTTQQQLDPFHLSMCILLCFTQILYSEVGLLPSLWTMRTCCP